jgi:YHS domain-containing protein
MGHFASLHQPLPRRAGQIALVYQPFSSRKRLARHWIPVTIGATFPEKITLSLHLKSPVMLPNFCARITAFGTMIVVVIAGATAVTGQEQGTAANPSTADSSGATGSLEHEQTGSFLLGDREVKVPIAMGGYCPVSILNARRWVAGSKQQTVLLDGKLYLFAGEAEKVAFLGNPVAFTPALGGDCVVTATADGTRVRGSIEFSAIHSKRLFLFQGAAEKEQFMLAPAKYENYDLGLFGNCPVCQVIENQTVRGDLTVGIMRSGIRYYFSSNDHKKEFLANPSKYLPQ